MLATGSLARTVTSYLCLHPLGSHGKRVAFVPFSTAADQVVLHFSRRTSASVRRRIARAYTRAVESHLYQHVMGDPIRFSGIRGKVKQLLACQRKWERETEEEASEGRTAGQEEEASGGVRIRMRDFADYLRLLAACHAAALLLQAIELLLIRSVRRRSRRRVNPST